MTLLDKLYYLLGQVDLSNCAVHYSYKFGLKESYLGAVNHCINGFFEEIKNTEMNTENTEQRIEKFINRGWINLKDPNNNKIIQKQILRIQKLNKILLLNKNKYYMPSAFFHKPIPLEKPINIPDISTL
jgi:hypothetical protein